VQRNQLGGDDLRTSTSRSRKQDQRKGKAWRTGDKTDSHKGTLRFGKKKGRKRASLTNRRGRIKFSLTHPERAQKKRTVEVWWCSLKELCQGSLKRRENRIGAKWERGGGNQGEFVRSTGCEGGGVWFQGREGVELQQPFLTKTPPHEEKTIPDDQLEKGGMEKEQGKK